MDHNIFQPRKWGKVELVNFSVQLQVVQDFFSGGGGLFHIVLFHDLLCTIFSQFSLCTNHFGTCSREKAQVMTLPHGDQRIKHNHEIHFDIKKYFGASKVN